MRHTEEIKKQISETKKRQYSENNGMPDETRKRISDGQKRRWEKIREGLSLLDALQKASKQAERLLD